MECGPQYISYPTHFPLCPAMKTMSTSHSLCLIYPPPLPCTLTIPPSPWKESTFLPLDLGSAMQCAVDTISGRDITKALKCTRETGLVLLHTCLHHEMCFTWGAAAPAAWLLGQSCPSQNRFAVRSRAGPSFRTCSREALSQVQLRSANPQTCERKCLMLFIHFTGIWGLFITQHY